MHDQICFYFVSKTLLVFLKYFGQLFLLYIFYNYFDSTGNLELLNNTIKLEKQSNLYCYQNKLNSLRNVVKKVYMFCSNNMHNHIPFTCFYLYQSVFFIDAAYTLN